MKLTKRFDQACAFARKLHHYQRRKGTEIPYMAHLMATAAIVMEAGGDEDQAIAALLHDAVEDQGGRWTLNKIEKQFGSRVAEMVEGMSDSFGFRKPPWRERKEEFLARLRVGSDDLVLVALGDKLHNARSLIRDLETEGPSTWERFNGGQDGSLWYYGSLEEIFNQRCANSFSAEFSRIVQALRVLSEQ